METLDDVWHVKHLVDEGDLVEALPARRDESQTDKLRTERGEKRRVVLGVRAEKVEKAIPTAAILVVIPLVKR